MKPIRTWILIADGARARIFENTGPGKGITDVGGGEYHKEVPPSREIDTDAPGRTFDRAAQGRHAKEPERDAHQVEEDRFIAELAEWLRSANVAGAYDRLILVADPKALGTLRRKLDDQTAKKVTAELAKDLTKIPERDLPKHLEEVIAV